MSLTLDKTDRNGHAPKVSAKDTASKRNPAWEVKLLPVAQIAPNPFQPRQSFDEEEARELAQSVAEHGVQQPVIVRTSKPVADKNGGEKNGETTPSFRYYLVVGERRLRASVQAGRKTIPAIVRDDLSDAQVAELALIENVQRSNLTIIEEGRGYKRLMLDFRMKEERIAKKVGKSVATIQAAIRLLDLPESVQTMLLQKKLTATHGHELLRLAPFSDLCVSVALRAVNEKLTAVSLADKILPHAETLEKQKNIVALDYRTKFDWKEECAKCPFKAFVKSGYASYCLKPDEWKRKQQGAIALQEQEAARVLQEAKNAGESVVETEDLPPNSYRTLAFIEPPAGCSEVCPCRSKTAQGTPICTDKERFDGLMQAQRKALEEERQRRYLTLFQNAIQVLNTEWKSGQPVKSAVLLSLPALYGSDNVHYGSLHGSSLYRGDRDGWQGLVMGVASAVGVALPWKEIFDPDTAEAAVVSHLETQSPQAMLRFTLAMQLAQEAQRAIRFISETPCLDYVLGLAPPEQTELSENDDTDEESESEASDVISASELQESDEDNASTHREEGDFNSEALELENAPSERDNILSEKSETT